MRRKRFILFIVLACAGAFIVAGLLVHRNVYPKYEKTLTVHSVARTPDGRPLITMAPKKKDVPVIEYMKELTALITAITGLILAVREARRNKH